LCGTLLFLANTLTIRSKALIFRAQALSNQAERDMLLGNHSIQVRSPANKEDIFSMVSSRKQLSPCPVCNRADQVKKMQTAYEAGELRIAPPPMPESHSGMIGYVSVGMIVVGIAVILIFVMLATDTFSVLQWVLTMMCIVAALTLSFMAIRRIGKADEETRQRYPIWDQAMSHWTRLQFCSRDKVVFDPQSNKTLNDAAVKALIDMDHPAEQIAPARVAVSH